MANPIHIYIRKLRQRLLCVPPAVQCCQRDITVFDIDILVKLYWSGVPVISSPVKVTYPEGGISNFRMVHDNIEISMVHTSLFFGMLVRLPKLLALRKRNG